MSVVLPGEAESRDMRASARRIYSRAVALFADGSDHSIARRVAGAAFLIRVASAALVFLSQILLARWMGSFEFGIYVYVWTWVLLLGELADLGLASAAQRFIPEYSAAAARSLLRGFLLGSRWLAFGARHDRGRDRRRAACSLLAAAAGILLRRSRSSSPASCCRLCRRSTCRTASRAPTTGSTSR